jgi:hypothetical protein
MSIWKKQAHNSSNDENCLVGKHGVEQEQYELPSTMSVRKSIDSDPGFSFSGDIKEISFKN